MSYFEEYHDHFVPNRSEIEMHWKHDVPDAVGAIVNKRYMDDYLDSIDEKTNAIKLVKEVIGDSNIIGWASNSMEEILLKTLPLLVWIIVGPPQYVLAEGQRNNII